jgi:hypothetical protein
MREAPPSPPQENLYILVLPIPPSPHPNLSKQSSHNISKLALLRTRSNLYVLSSGWEYISLHVTSQLENLSWGA